MKELLYALNGRLFVLMQKYGEQIGTDNEYVKLVADCLDIIAEDNGISEEEHQKIINNACEDFFVF